MKAKDGVEFRERILPGAISKEDLAKARSWYAHKLNDATHLLGNAKAGTMRTEMRDNGIYVAIDLPSTSCGNDCLEQVERGDLEGFSFAMTNVDATYVRSGNMIYRTIHKLTLKSIDPVDYPAYDTEIELRSMAEQIKEVEEKEVVETPETETQESTEQRSVTGQQTTPTTTTKEKKKDYEQPDQRDEEFVSKQIPQALDTNEVRSIIADAMAEMKTDLVAELAKATPQEAPKVIETITKSDPNKMDKETTEVRSLGDDLVANEFMIVEDALNELETRSHTNTQTGTGLQAVPGSTQENIRVAKDALEPTKIWKMLGCNHEQDRYSQRIPVMDLLSHTGIDFTTEVGAAAEIQTNIHNKYLTPRALRRKMIFSDRIMMQDKISFTNKGLRDGKNAIDKGIEAKFFGNQANTADGTPAGMGHSTNSTAVDASSDGVISKDNILAYIRTLDSAYSFDCGQPVMVVAKNVFYAMAGIKLDSGSGRFLLTNVTLGSKGVPSTGVIADLGIKVITSDFLPAGAAYLGAFEGVVCNTFRNMRMRYDDITLRDEGKVKWNWDIEVDWINVYPTAMLYITGIVLSA